MICEKPGGRAGGGHEVGTCQAARTAVAIAMNDRIGRGCRRSRLKRETLQGREQRGTVIAQDAIDIDPCGQFHVVVDTENVGQPPRRPTVAVGDRIDGGVRRTVGGWITAIPVVALADFQGASAAAAQGNGTGGARQARGVENVAELTNGGEWAVGNNHRRADRVHRIRRVQRWVLRGGQNVIVWPGIGISRHRVRFLRWVVVT